MYDSTYLWSDITKAYGTSLLSWIFVVKVMEDSTGYLIELP